MKRLFWFTVGTATGVYATRKVQQKLRSYTPAGWSAQAAGAVAEAGRFVQDVRAAMSEREAELNHTIGLTDSLPATESDLLAVGADRPNPPQNGKRLQWPTKSAGTLENGSRFKRLTR